MDTINLILREFDVRKLNRACNHKGCEKIPTKEMLIYETDFRNQRRKDLVSLYFCSKHYEVSKKFLQKLAGVCEKGRVVDKKVFDIGYVTY